MDSGEVNNGLDERQALRQAQGGRSAGPRVPLPPPTPPEDCFGFAPQQGRSAADVADSAWLGCVGFLGVVAILIILWLAGV